MQRIAEDYPLPTLPDPTQQLADELVEIAVKKEIELAVEQAKKLLKDAHDEYFVIDDRHEIIFGFQQILSLKDVIIKLAEIQNNVQQMTKIDEQHLLKIIAGYKLIANQLNSYLPSSIAEVKEIDKNISLALIHECQLNQLLAEKNFPPVQDIEARIFEAFDKNIYNVESQILSDIEGFKQDINQYAKEGVSQLLHYSRKNKVALLNQLAIKCSDFSENEKNIRTLLNQLINEIDACLLAIKNQYSEGGEKKILEKLKRGFNKLLAFLNHYQVAINDCMSTANIYYFPLVRKFSKLLARISPAESNILFAQQNEKQKTTFAPSLQTASLFSHQSGPAQRENGEKENAPDKRFITRH